MSGSKPVPGPLRAPTLLQKPKRLSDWLGETGGGATSRLSFSWVQTRTDFALRASTASMFDFCLKPGRPGPV